MTVNAQKNANAIPGVQLSDGFVIPQLGIGTYQLPNDEAEAIVAAGLELGYRHIDTASLYKNEEGVGKAVAASGLDRSDVWVTTKLWHTDHGDPLGGLRASLDRLQLDYVDLFLIHWPTPKLGTAWQAWEGLIEARELGLTRSIGVSNFEIEHLERIIGDTGATPSVNQIELHPHHQRRELVEYCKQRNIVIESWSPLAQGRKQLFADPAVADAAKAHGKSPAQIVLRWHLEKGFVVFPKTATASRLGENLDIFDFELTAAEIEAIDELEGLGESSISPYDMNG